MKTRDPFQQALVALTALAGDGRLVWGEPLVATALAKDFGLSPTPVREALARLSGEGLIDHRPGRGYFAPGPGAQDVVDLIEHHRRLVHWALDLIEQAGPAAPFGPVDGVSVERLFAVIVRACDSAVVVRAHWRVALQLRPIRRIQARLSPPEADWIGRVMPLVIACDLGGIRREVDRHHRESTVLSSAVVAELRRVTESIVQI